MVALEAGLRNKANGLLESTQAEKLWTGIAEIEKLSAADLAKFLHAPQPKSNTKVE